MTRAYAVYYDGKLASRHLTRVGALAAIGKYVTERKWDGAKLELKGDQSNEN